MKVLGISYNKGWGIYSGLG